MRPSERVGAGAVVTSAVLFVVAIFAACAHRDNGQTAALSQPAAEASRPDAGLPPPPPAARKGIMVPSDMGFGAGPVGPTTNSGTPPSTPQPTVPNGM